MSYVVDQYEEERTAYRAGDLERAAKLLEPLVAAGNVDATTLLGYVFYRQNRLEDSERLFLKLWNAKLGGSDVPFGLGLVAAARNDLKTARRWGLEAQKLDPGRSDVVEFLSKLPLSPEEIRLYVASGECDDKAGAYAIQGRAARFITELRGSYSGVMGLPLYETAQLLERRISH